MPTFSQKSLTKLSTVHPDLQRLFKEIILHVDCTILEGIRSEERQAKLYAEGATKTMLSKHLEGKAVDVMPWPLDWEDWDRNYAFCGYVRGVADMMGIKIRAGWDWDGDFTLTDQSFHDLPHWELIEE